MDNDVYMDKNYNQRLKKMDILYENVNGMYYVFVEFDQDSSIIVLPLGIGWVYVQYRIGLVQDRIRIELGLGQVGRGWQGSVFKSL